MFHIHNQPTQGRTTPRLAARSTPPQQHAAANAMKLQRTAAACAVYGAEKKCFQVRRKSCNILTFKTDTFDLIGPTWFKRKKIICMIVNI
jgi:hypothetical protein